MRALFTVTIALGAVLLFLVQPLVGRLLLPRLGGSPTVWSTCMVFFQAALLAGYAYAHLLTRITSARRQVVVHAAVLLGAAAALPVGLPAWLAPASAGHPVPWLLGALAVTVGVPFFVVSTSAPLLQRWFAATDDPEAHDPYFLYAASNTGSLVALVAYPVLAEPLLGLGRQATGWSAAYGVFALATVACGFVMLRRPTSGARAFAAEPDAASAAAPSRRDWLRWTVLAFLPSSLMLGATHQITTDVAAVPLFWIVPLALYLLTFVLAFARRPPLSVRASTNAFIGPAIAVLVVSALPQVVPVAISLGLNLVLVLFAGLMCHGRLAATRPHPRYLTSFYLALGVGGALGGTFNALVAPVLFTDVLEYPLVIVLAFFGRPRSSLGSTHRPTVRWANYLLDITIVAVAVVHVPALARSLDSSQRTLYMDRTFFGVHRVSTGVNRTWIRYDHGTTCHGLQDRNAPGESQSYYHDATGMGRLLAFLGGDPRLDRVGVLGLGAGTLATRAGAGQHMTFYEIDPAVARIASDPELFTYLRDTAGTVDIVIGDGRLAIAEAPDGTFGLLVLDAFSSDAIPVHLLTLEAMETYLRKLTDDGMIAVNISNRHLDLRPLLGALARRVDRIALHWPPVEMPATGDGRRGKFSADWIVLARVGDAEAIERHDPVWVRLEAPDGATVWTDDYSNLLGSLRWW